MTTWRKELEQALLEHGESWEDVEASTLSADEMTDAFDPSYGGIGGASFTLWTRNRVYFPWCYDGAEGVSSVPRHPNGEKTEHIGGG